MGNQEQRQPHIETQHIDLEPQRHKSNVVELRNLRSKLPVAKSFLMKDCSVDGVFLKVVDVAKINASIADVHTPLIFAARSMNSNWITILDPKGGSLISSTSPSTNTGHSGEESTPPVGRTPCSGQAIFGLLSVRPPKLQKMGHPRVVVASAVVERSM